VAHATALVQRAEKEATLCEAAIDNLSVELGKMEEALERAQQKAASGVPSTLCSARQNHHLLTLWTRSLSSVSNVGLGAFKFA